MSHAGQDGIASMHGLEFALPEGMPGKHGLGAVGEFVRERFRDGGAKIIARLAEDAPGQIFISWQGKLSGKANGSSGQQP